MTTPAQQRAALFRGKQRLHTLLSRTPNVRLLELQPSNPLPEALASYWNDFVQVDDPIGDRLSRTVEDMDRNQWLLAAILGQSFPARFLLVLPPASAVIEVLAPDWLLHLYQVLDPFDLVLLDEQGSGIIAFSDDEEGLRRLVVQDGRLTRPPPTS